MVRRPNFRSLRGRLFVALVLTASVPTGLLLLGGSLMLQRLLVLSGSTGPWEQVARSGQELLEALEALPELEPALSGAAERHRADLSEGVRLSRMYRLIGERALALVPGVAGVLFLVGAGAAMASARQVSRTLSRPVDELVDWTEAVGRGAPLPPPDPRLESREIREVVRLRGALRSMERMLAEGRRRELREARNQSWSDMARRIAHDLRNPLAPMQMAAQRVAASPDPSMAEAGEVLLDEISRLENLSRSFSQFGRPPEGPPSLVDLGELLSHLVPRLDRDGQRVRLHGPARPVWVEGHPVALERVMQNLIANALDAMTMSVVSAGDGTDSHPNKTGRDHTPIEVHVGVRPHPASGYAQACMEVLDRGPGLPVGAEDRIWEADFTTKRSGTGLGLPLVAQVVEAHRGLVEAWNRAEGGAGFRVILPLASRPGEAGAP
jgi:signal transduction histidine kinase